MSLGVMCNLIVTFVLILNPWLPRATHRDSVRPVVPSTAGGNAFNHEASTQLGPHAAVVPHLWRSSVPNSTCLALPLCPPWLSLSGSVSQQPSLPEFTGDTMFRPARSCSAVPSPPSRPSHCRVVTDLPSVHQPSTVSQYIRPIYALPIIRLSVEQNQYTVPLCLVTHILALLRSAYQSASTNNGQGPDRTIPRMGLSHLSPYRTSSDVRRVRDRGTARDRVERGGMCDDGMSC